MLCRAMFGADEPPDAERAEYVDAALSVLRHELDAWLYFAKRRLDGDEQEEGDGDGEHQGG
jgi:hypothetical protein